MALGVNDPSNNSPQTPYLYKGGLGPGLRQDYVYLCLNPLVCYRAVAGGEDTFQYEVRWQIARSILGTEDEVDVAIAKGGSPANCVFSVPIDDGFGNVKYFCNSTCTGVQEDVVR